MLKVRKREHVKNLLDELSDFKIPDMSEEKESPYFIDYLYGVSDINLEIEKLISEDIFLIDWILFNRILLDKETIKLKNYNQFRIENYNYFLMRNKEDLKIFQDYLKSPENRLNNLINEKIEDIYNRYKEKIEDEKIKEKFKILLKNYLVYEAKDRDSYEYNMHTVKLGEFIKSNRAILRFNQGDFFKNELEFNDNNRYPKIKRRYEKEKMNYE